MAPLRAPAALVALPALLALPVLLALPAHPARGENAAVGAVPPPLREKLRLDPFYQKHLSAAGLPILASSRVSDAALQEARHIIDGMLQGRDDLRAAIISQRVRVAVMAPTEVTTDVPEHSDLMPRDYWNRRARGLGATRQRPAVSCGEENLLNLPGDRYPTENILVHEFAHVVHQMGLNSLRPAGDRTNPPAFEQRLRAAYRAAMDEGLWKGTYAATNAAEYWAEGVQSYFDTNRPPDRDHNHVDTRDELRAYDARLYALIDAELRGNPWRYVRYDRRVMAQTPPPQE